MNDKPKYVIQKNVPLPEPRTRKLYEYQDIPFDQMEVGDCVSIAFKNLIPNNSHPDSKERQSRSKNCHDELPEKESFLIGNSRQDKTSRCLIVATHKCLDRKQKSTT
jgi:hypothetical protein